MDLAALLGPRSVEDTLAERVVLTIGGTEYVLPVLPMRASRDWEERLDGALVGLLAMVRDEGDDVAALLQALSESPWPFIDLLLEYDRTGVLPDRDTIYSVETEMGLLCATLEVWRAAHPLADIGIELFAMAGRRGRSLPQLESLLWLSGDTTTADSRPN